MSEMISVAPGFQYSVNIAFDLYDDDKLKSFIPTKSALSLLEDILRSTDKKSTDRARILIGAYGKGKSHIVLMILSMLMKRDLSLFEKTMPKIRENPRLLQLVENYYDSNNKILPVIITGSNTNLTQAFLRALQRVLSDNDLMDVMPETNYKAAIKTINKWEREFPQTYEAFQVTIEQPVRKFIERLENYDASAYELFERIYPTLTAGSIFNPFLGFDVVDLYEDVAKSIRKKGYTGLYVIYDEFSKYLETNITEASVSDTKMLQDFAEKCDRSGELQLHIMLISHKEISNYIDKLPREKVDGWRGVSGRFKHIRVNNNFTQTYEIISTVIQKKEPLWQKFCEEHQKDFDELFHRYEKHTMFSDAKEEIGFVIKGCFPLHPASTFILPRLSERVAENERTLFTFLSSKGISTLPEFLETYNDKEFKLITPDQIYDYFEPLFKKEAYGNNVHENYILTTTILNQLSEESLESKIVKAISLIYSLEQFEKLKPTIDEIVGIFANSYNVEEIKAAINNLVEKEFVIYIKRSNGYLRLKKSSGVDVQQKIKDFEETQGAEKSVKDILNAANFDNYMYPSRYNDEHEMIRYFSFEFINAEEITAETDWDIKSERIKADGVIYGVIPTSEEEIGLIADRIKKSSQGKARYIFVLPKHYKEIIPMIQEYQAVITLRDQAMDDPILFDEYEVIYEDLYEIIKKFINTYTHPEEYAAQYIFNGNIVTIGRKAALTELMSEICDTVYSETPVINNESVNKDEISSAAAISRNKIVSGLLRGELEPNLGFTGSGQEVSIMRSTLVRTGIWSEDDGFPKVNLRPQDERMSNMLSTIENFILESRQNVSLNFGILYEELVSPDNHIGLRYGLIPIYLAVVIHEYRQQIVITDRFGQVPVNADILAQINAEPLNFNLEYLDWDQEKEAYIERLSDTFSDFVIEAEKRGNLYDYVANAMHRWYMALPKYSKECKAHPSGGSIAKQQLEMIKLLRQNINGSDLLFKELPKVFDYKNFSSDVAEDIINTRKLYDGLLSELQEYLIGVLQGIFKKPKTKDIEKKMSLTSVMKEWVESLDPLIFEQLFSDGTDRFLDLIKNMSNDEETFITQLAKLITDLRLEDWDSDTSKFFESRVKHYKETAEAFLSDAVTKEINTVKGYEVTFTNEDGVAVTKRFDKVDISARGKLLSNQITSSLDAMGHSISEQEKRQVLIEILKKLC